MWVYKADTGEDLPSIPVALPPPAVPSTDKEKPDPSPLASGLAANDEELALCYPAQGIVRWCDPVSGMTPARRRNLTVFQVTDLDHPSAIAMSATGTTFVICGNSVLRLDRTGKAHTTLITGLNKPDRIAVSPTGDLLIHDSVSEQVIRFSSAGKRLAAYGQEGGRHDGIYDRTAQEKFSESLSSDGHPG